MIRLENISKTYDMKKTTIKALDSINLSFDSTGLVLLVGESGAGKSTLLNIITKNIFPTKGQLVSEFEDESYSSIVLQNVVLFNELTIKENIDLIYSFYPYIANKTDYYIEKFQLSHIKDSYPNQISGGEKQRVSIILSLIQEKPVLIYDEPTSNLDYENSKLIVQMLKEVSLNKLVIVSTHDVEIFDEYYTRKIELSKGKIVFDETLEKGNKLPSTFVKTNFNSKITNYLVLKNLKRNFVKFLTNSLVLMITFILLFFSLNIFFLKEEKMRAKVYDENKLSYVDFNGSEFVDEINQKKNVTFNQTIEVEQKYSGSISYFDGDFSLNDHKLARIYFSNECNEKLHCGSKKLKQSEIIITDQWIRLFLGEQNNSFNKYLGHSLYSVLGKELKIVGVINTDNEKIEHQEKSTMAYMTFDTFVESLLLESLELNITPPNNDTLLKQKIVYDELLEEGHFIIGKKYANELELIQGETYNISFEQKYKYKIVNEKENPSFLELTFDGYSEQFDDALYVFSKNDYKKTYLTNNEIIFRYGYLGVSIRGVNIDELEAVRSIGLYDDTYLERELEEDFLRLKEISKILLLFTLPLIIISLFLLINYSNILFDKMKVSILLLKIIGIKKKNIVKVIFRNILFTVCCAFFLTIILSAIFTPKVSLFMTIVMLSLNIIYFSNITALFLLLLVVIYSLCAYFLISLKISSKIEL